MQLKQGDSQYYGRWMTLLVAGGRFGVKLRGLAKSLLWAVMSIRQASAKTCVAMDIVVKTIELPNWSDKTGVEAVLECVEME